MPPAATLATAIATTTAPLDALRRAALALVARSALLRRVFLPREPRIAAGVVVHATLAFLGAVFFPMVLLLAGPVVLGVPHLAADLRHLVLRRDLGPRGRRLGLLAAGTLFAVAFGASFVPGLSSTWSTRLTVATADLWLLVFVVRLGAQGLGRRQVLVLALALVLTALGWASPRAFTLGFAHAHNVVGLVAVARLVRDRQRLWALLLMFVLGLAGLLASGALAAITLASPGAALAGTHLLVMADALAPGVDAHRATALTTAFAFLQSVHYAVWLFVIPELDRERAAPTTFRTRVGSWVDDFGLAGALAVASATVVILAFACASLYGACMKYLGAAAFHGYFELVLLAAWYLRAHEVRATGRGQR